MKLVVKTIPGLDGEYDLITPPYSSKEWHAIKIHTGLRPLEVEDAWRAGDPDVLVTFAWVSLTRAGHNPLDVWGALDECEPFTSLVFDFDDAETRAAEADARPPDSSPTTSGSENLPVGSESEIEQSESSGESSSKGGVHLESVPSPTGSQLSDTGPDSAPATSAI